MKETRIILWLGAVLFLAWLFYQNLVPTGVLVLQNKKGDPASLISDLHPEKRVIETDDSNQTFYVDPVYFDAKVPREFKKVKVNLAWQNKAQPILELGANKARGTFGFELRALQNKIIDGLSWLCVRDGELLFCQKSKKYNNFEAYLKNPSGKLLVYRYKPNVETKYDVMNVESDINKYDYLIANYTAPQALGDDWYQREVEYAWSDFEVYINEISFLLSAPQLNHGHGDIAIGDIRVTLEREPLDWPGFVDYVKNQLRRLRK
ncbi:MAG: hypothetical protein AAB880_02175 [Patescibacteria group bacterium]